MRANAGFAIRNDGDFGRLFALRGKIPLTPTLSPSLPKGEGAICSPLHKWRGVGGEDGGRGGNMRPSPLVERGRRRGGKIQMHRTCQGVMAINMPHLSKGARAMDGCAACFSLSLLGTEVPRQGRERGILE
jgi:hypothetical protein